MNRILLKRSNDTYNIFKHPRFTQFRRVFDGYLKEIQATELISTYKSDTLEIEDEEKIEALLGWETAEQLLTSLIYKTTYTWTFRGGTILSTLTTDNFTFHEEKDRYTVTYTEKKSKNNQPGIRNINHSRKQVTHFDCKTDPTSFTALYHIYLSRCHPSVRDPEQQIKLFQHPIKNPKSEIWFGTKNHLGRNYFNILMKKLYSEAGVEGKFTLRSLRPSAVTRLNEAGVDDEVIRMRTGHKTREGLNEYKRPLKTKSILNTSEILRGPNKRSKILPTINIFLSPRDIVIIIVTVVACLILFFIKLT